MRNFVLVVAALASLACVNKAPGAPTPNRNLITADEIAKSNGSTAYEVIQRLRPAFLRTRGSQSIQNPAPLSPIVYLDGMRFGPVSSLAQIPALGIMTIEYMNAVDASQRFGLGNEGGAILVATKH
jgi:hypothetical protein